MDVLKKEVKYCNRFLFMALFSALNTIRLMVKDIRVCRRLFYRAVSVLTTK